MVTFVLTIIIAITLSAILTLIYFFHGIKLDYNSVFDNYTKSITLIGEIDPLLTPYESAKDNLKEARMRQIRSQHQQKIENLGKGHGQYREITQDEFIQEITGSMSVICHFFHRDFQKCEIMNLHLSKLAQRHIESKFVRINAEKTPFFVEKVRILINPRILLYYFVTTLYLLSFVIVMFIG